MDTRRVIALVEASSLPHEVRGWLVELVREQQAAATTRRHRDRLLRLLAQFTGRREPWAQAGVILGWCRQFERRRWPAIRTRGLSIGDLEGYPPFVGGFLLDLYKLTNGDLPTSQKQISRILTVDNRK